MNKKQRDEQYKLFADTFHEVVPPLLENLATKDDLNNAVDRLERRIDKIDDRLDRHGKILDDHEKKFEKIATNLHLASL